MKVFVKLWSINRLLRYTGFRLFVMVHMDENGKLIDSISIGVVFYGWGFIKAREPWNQ